MAKKKQDNNGVSRLKAQRAKEKQQRDNRRIKKHANSDNADWQEFTNIAATWKREVEKITRIVAQASALANKLEDKNMKDQVLHYAAKLGLLNQQFENTAAKYINNSGPVAQKDIPEYLEAMFTMTNKLIPILNEALEEFSDLSELIEAGMARLQDLKDDEPSEDTKALADELETEE